MNKILQTIYQTSPNARLVFDIDGVLASYEYGKYNHGYPQEQWTMLVSKTDPYQLARPFRVFQKLIAEKSQYCHACSVVDSENEAECKRNFLHRHYWIPDENIHFVHSSEEKLTVLEEIYKESDVFPNDIVLIEDTIATLDYVAERSMFSTIHVSSFLE
jgi:hypothetical protein